MLDFAIDEMSELGSPSGGAVPAAERRAALTTFARFPALVPQPRLRHDFATLRYDELAWTSGRMRVAALPQSRRARAVVPEGTDVPALAVENAGGIVHAGSTYLQPTTQRGDTRVVLSSLADAASAVPQRVAAIRGRIARVAGDRFVALATAFQNCGAYVDIPPGVSLDAPLVLLWTGAPGSAQAIFPQTIVRVGAGSNVTFVERHVGNVDALLCGTVEIEVEPGAHVDYVVVQEIDDGARVLMSRGARCAQGASIAWHVAELGGALVRSTFATHLRGADARVETRVLSYPRGFAQVDVHVSCAHEATRTASATLSRGAASERGVGRFFGHVRIPRRAGGTTATMRADGLVLSRDAYIEAVPTLDIATNDVAAAHAATIGSLDEEQLFYVRTRGIARGAAERMLALAFFEPLIVRFPSDALRDEIRTALDALLDEIPETFTA